MTVNKLQAFFAGTLNRSLLAAALVTAPAVSTVVVSEVSPQAAGWLQGSAVAQELIQPASEPPETRRIPSITLERCPKSRVFLIPRKIQGSNLI